jgi:hypothetical protein
LLFLSRDIFLHEFVSSLVSTLLSDSLFCATRRAARNKSTLMEPEMDYQKLEKCPEIVHGTRGESRNTRTAAKASPKNSAIRDNTLRGKIHTREFLLLFGILREIRSIE